MSRSRRGQSRNFGTYRSRCRQVLALIAGASRWLDAIAGAANGMKEQKSASASCTKRFLPKVPSTAVRAALLYPENLDAGMVFSWLCGSKMPPLAESRHASFRRTIKVRWSGAFGSPVRDLNLNLNRFDGYAGRELFDSPGTFDG
jgi:hypothetical protein